MKSVAIFAFLFSILTWATISSAEITVGGKKVTPGSSGMSAADAADIWRAQICGGAAAVQKDKKEFNDCLEWQKNSEMMSDQLFADQKCGGRSAYEKDASKFEKCTSEMTEKHRSSRLQAEDACGGFAAHKKDAVTFRKCKISKQK